MTQPMCSSLLNPSTGLPHDFRDSGRLASRVKLQQPHRVAARDQSVLFRIARQNHPTIQTLRQIEDAVQIPHADHAAFIDPDHLTLDPVMELFGAQQIFNSVRSPKPRRGQIIPRGPGGRRKWTKWP